MDSPASMGTPFRHELKSDAPSQVRSSRHLGVLRVLAVFSQSILRDCLTAEIGIWISSVGLGHGLGLGLRHVHGREGENLKPATFNLQPTDRPLLP
jgi:hypothetical protein